jgi:hypothetical protein
VIPIAIFPPPVSTVSGDLITANRFANQPPLLAQAMRTLASYRYIGGLLLPRRVQTASGSIQFELNDQPITAVDVPGLVTPGSEYQLTTTANGTVSTAAVAKWGQDTIITDERISRLNYDAIGQALALLVNSAKIHIDTAVVAAVAAGITSNTQAATAVWSNESTSRILLDVMAAKSAIKAHNRGYNPDLLLIADEAEPYLASNPTIATSMAREDRTNPVYTGRFPVIAGLEVMTVPAANLPGGVATAAFVLDRSALGFVLTEDLGGGYQSAGDLVEMKSYREEGSDGVRVRARSNFKAVVTDPLAAQRITAILS